MDTFGYEFDTTVGQVADETCDIKARGDRFGREPKSHTLYAAREQNPAAD